MAEYFQQIMEWVRLNPGWAGMAVFAIAFIESLAIVGSIIPGVAILFGVGTMIGAGALNFWDMTLFAIIGAILGDSISFWFGKKYQLQLTNSWPLKQHPKTLQKGIDFFQRHGTLSVALGRFFGPIRAIIPLVAGMLNMPTRHFIFANVASALLWAPAYLLPGTLFGASMNLASEVAMRLAILLVLLLALLWFFGWLSHRLFLLIQPHAQQLLQFMLKLGTKNKMLNNIAGALANPAHPEAAGLAIFAGLLLVTSLAFILLNLLPAQPFAALDEGIRLAQQKISSAAGDQLMLSLSALADKTSSMALLGAIWGILKISRHPLAARHWLVGFGMVWVVSLLLEYLMRNNPGLIQVLPDIYILRAVTLYGLSAIICAVAIPVRYRWSLYSAASMLVFAIMLAQLYHGSTLGALLQGLVLGLLWSSAIGIAYRTHSQHAPIKIRQALIVAATIIIISIATSVTVKVPLAMPDIRQVRSMDVSTWWAHGWQQLPSHRDDIKAIKQHPLNIQFAGDMQQLSKVLVQQGWQLVRSDFSLDWLRVLSATVTMETMPALPHSHNGHYETYQFIKPADKQRQVLYFWPSRYQTSRGVQIWLGTTGRQQMQHLLGILSYPVTDKNHLQPLQEIAQTLKDSHLLQKFVHEQLLLLRE